MNKRWTQWLAVAGCLGALQAQAVIEEISPDWQAADKQRLEIASAEASASLSEQYAPGRIHDGDRHTKWVCPTKPSAANPTPTSASPQATAPAIHAGDQPRDSPRWSKRLGPLFSPPPASCAKWALSSARELSAAGT